MMKLNLKQKNGFYYFFISSIIFMIIMIGCSVPGSRGGENSSKETEEVTTSGSFSIKVNPNTMSLNYSIIDTEVYTVTALDITVTYVSTSNVVGTFNWTPADGVQTYSVDINQYGEYEVSVIQTAVNDNDPSDIVTTEDSVIVDIQPMKVTIVTIVPGASLDIVIDDEGTPIEAPTIVSSSPANGELGVDYEITNLTITFDQDMFSGYDYNFEPYIDRSEEWINSTTFRINFNEELNDLETYTITLNPSGSDQQFQNLSGVRLAMDTIISFTTKAWIYDISGINSPDLIIYDAIVERVGDSIRFSIDYESGYERGYSFFNPPGGDIFMYSNLTTGIYVGRHIFTIEVPVSDVSQTDYITMLFLRDEEDNMLCFKTAGFAELLY